MKKTNLSHILKIDFPVIQGGMLWLASAELASSVSNAGGLGVISPLANMESQDDPFNNLTKQIFQTKQLTKNPFGVNLPIDLPYVDGLIDIVIREKIGIVITAAGSPDRYSQALKSRGILQLHVVSNVQQAKKAESSGVDGIIAEGFEAAAHVGPDELPLFSLLPQVVDSVSVPVVAAGGIVDARGVVAAMALGAEGVQLGTRFVAVEENIAHINYKKAIIAADDTDTVITGRNLVPTRSLKTPFSNCLIELEKSEIAVEDLQRFIGFRSNRRSQIEGHLANGEAYCGASAGLIKQIVPAAKVVEDLVKGYKQVLETLCCG